MLINCSNKTFVCTWMLLEQLYEFCWVSKVMSHNLKQVNWTEIHVQFSCRETTTLFFGWMVLDAEMRDGIYERNELMPSSLLPHHFLHFHSLDFSKLNKCSQGHQTKESNSFQEDFRYRLYWTAPLSPIDQDKRVSLLGAAVLNWLSTVILLSTQAK